jgi:hypothetical protein
MGPPYQGRWHRGERLRWVCCWLRAEQVQDSVEMDQGRRSTGIPPLCSTLPRRAQWRTHLFRNEIRLRGHRISTGWGRVCGDSGQEVVVCEGASMPLVLDMLSDSSIRMGRLIAPAFVSCLMDGEMDRSRLGQGSVQLYELNYIQQHSIHVN